MPESTPSEDTLAERARILAVVAPILHGHHGDRVLNLAMHAINEGKTREQMAEQFGEPWSIDHVTGAPKAVTP